MGGKNEHMGKPCTEYVNDLFILFSSSCVLVGFVLVFVFIGAKL